ncbi:unnamed protein product [Paramecium primaurelia]|uniref:Uncharacterized protein n=1 Tax=Paramecium primaurelia TaxID=5886 RepID=A0A8S1Q7S9_PARPR|nr:unnamed protein product [Paramecium primaurelia]
MQFDLRNFDIKSHSIQDTNHLQSIAYGLNTNKYNMGSSKLNFDPYSQDDKIYEILTECKTEYQDIALSYRMRVKSFFCQLDEFYISGSCQICQSDKGFNSMTYNTTKCPTFDKTKFQAITSNGIQLKTGYWRPNYVSNFIERCYKNADQCLGGWSIGGNSDLCEECDKFDLRGDGQYFKNQYYLECQQFQELSKRLIAFFLILFQQTQQIIIQGRFYQLYLPSEALKNQINYLHRLNQNKNLPIFYSILIKIMKVFYLNYFQITYGYFHLLLNLHQIFILFKLYQIIQ